MKKTLFYIFFLLIVSNIFALSQNNLNNTNSIEEDDAETEKKLEEWLLIDEKNPDVYIAYFNYYFEKSEIQSVEVSKNIPGPNVQYIPSVDENGNSIYLYIAYSYEQEYIDLAVKYIDKGISFNPERLDLYCLKISMYFQIGCYEKEKNELLKLIKLNKKYKNKWLWTNGLSADKNLFENNINIFIQKLIDTHIIENIIYANEISLLMYEQYPKNVTLLNLIGISYIYTGNLKSSLDYLNKANKINPNDMLIIANLAYCYRNLHDLEKAKFYYQYMIDNGTENYKNFALKQLEDIEQKGE